MIRRAFLWLMALWLPACSPKLVAVNLLGDALVGGGGVYASDEDPDLVREAIPFGLKTYEALLDVSPDHRGLLLSAASGFTAYAYLIQDEADRLDAADLARARALRAVVVLSVLLLVGSSAPAQMIKLGTFAPEGSPWYTIVRDMTESWKSTSSERVQFRIYPGGIAGDEPDMVAAQPLGWHSGNHAGVQRLCPEPHAGGGRNEVTGRAMRRGAVLGEGTEKVEAHSVGERKSDDPKAI